MRFHLGPVPSTPGFDPEMDGWTKIREPSPGRIQVLALPLAFLLAGAALGLVLALTPIDVPNPWEDNRPMIPIRALPGVLLLFVVLIPVHELIHAVLHPGLGLSRHTVIGAWPSKLLFYAFYDGPKIRERFLLVASGPFLVLTLGPVLAAAVFGLDWPVLALVAVMNALASYGDAAAILILAWQVPRGAVVRNQGYETWWRPALRPSSAGQ
jgi:hypothetical protein